MPIRLKGFARRRSSGNALEEVPLPNPPEPSFKVFARRPSASKSFDGGNSAQYIADGRPKSAGHYLDSFPSENDRYDKHLSNRGSSGTNNSSSSGGLFDASSARYSSSSTLPSTSSNEAIHDEYSHAHPKPVYGLPQSASQPSFSLRAKGRTWSFGKKLVQQQQQESPQSPTEHQSQVPVVPPIRDVPAIPRPLSKTLGVEDTGGMYSRPRAMTDQSYASETTAKPPVLPMTTTSFQDSDGAGEFGNIFQDYDSPRFHTAPTSAASSQTFNRLAQDDQPPKVPPKGQSPSSRSSYATPPPLSVNYSRAITPSPYSHDSHDSRDGLLYNQSPALNPKSSPYLPETSLPRPRSIVDTLGSLQSSASSSNSPTRERPSNMRRTSAYSSKRASTPLHDSDAMLVMDSINASKTLNRQSVTFEDSPRQIVPRKSLPVEPRNPTKPTPYTHYNHPGPEALGGRYNPINLYDEYEQDTAASNTWHNESLDSTPRAQKPELSQPESQPQSHFHSQPEDSDLLFDPAFQQMAKSAEQIETGRISPPPQPPSHIGKVMTPAQYEKYRKEKEMSSTRSTSSKEDSDDEDNHYDDEDEAERNRQVVKQRRKQEAHLSVYRQQMMKVTGEQPKAFDPKRPGLGVSHSTPVLSTRLSNANLKAGNSGKNSDDEDEDVPLGILAAHGFPSKDRLPGQLDRTNSTPVIRYQSETYPPPSAAGGSVAGGPTGSLPPFARNLPKDPYFGASLVNPANREAAGFGNNGGGSVYGGSQVGSPHPAGLVGVIASEEKARALRRGSPNTQAGWGGNPFPQGMSSMTPSLSPGDQAQIQMSQQMQQMMQMQMQWMQQMMAMQQGQQTLAPPQMPFMQGQMPPGGFLSPQNPNMLRPMSMGSNAMPSPQAQQQQRAMSMLNPNVSQQWGQQSNRNTGTLSMMSGALVNQGYAPSIAPSERSNIGQPSRYRPVSIAPNEKNSRSNTLSSQNILQGWNGAKSGGVQATVKAVSGDAKGKQTAGKGSDDEDDDAGWKALEANREKKKSSWKLKKTDDNGLGDLYYGA